MNTTQYGAWTVLGKDPSSNRRTLCRCECGTERSVITATLVRGSSTRCRRCGYKRGATKHGACGTDEYRIWKNIKARCTSPANPSYGRYGGRGIKVCKRWLVFTAFLADMGQRPSKKHSIERIDNDGPYSPDNCKWATAREQSRNTRRNNRLTLNGRTQCLTDWANETGIPRAALTDRINKLGWTSKRALTTPVGSENNSHRIVEYRGESMTVAELSRRTGIKYQTLWWRLVHKGMSVLEAVSV